MVRFSRFHWILCITPSHGRRGGPGGTAAVVVPQLVQVETFQTLALSMEAPKKKQRVDKQGRASAHYVQKSLEALRQAKEQDIR